jgi:hypothetical protein
MQLHAMAWMVFPRPWAASKHAKRKEGEKRRGTSAPDSGNKYKGVVWMYHFVGNDGPSLVFEDEPDSIALEHYTTQHTSQHNKFRQAARIPSKQTALHT